MTAAKDSVELVDDGDRERLVELVAGALGSSPDLAAALDSFRSQSTEFPMQNSRMWLGRDLEHEPGLDGPRAMFERCPHLWARRRLRGTWWVGGGAGSAGVSYAMWEVAEPATSMAIYGLTGMTALLGGITAVLATSTGVVKLCAPPWWQRRAAWRELVGEAALLAGASAPTKNFTAQVPVAASTVTIAGVRQALTSLLGEWATYRLDVEAWYLTKPLLHDTTGTVATTVAYEAAMADLSAAVDDLHDASPAAEVAAAAAAADRAWAAWHEANDYAAEVGVDDRTPTERAALQRLSKLVTRLTRTAAGDPELTAIKRDVQTCLDKVTTVSVGWGDIGALPAIERAGVLPKLDRTNTRKESPTHAHSGR